MTALWGTIVNALAVVCGGLLGAFLPKMPERVRAVIMQGLGLAVLFIGISSGIKSGDFLFAVIALAIGGAIGAGLRLEERLQSVGGRVEHAVKKLSGGGGAIAEGFVTATLLFCVGAMAVVGALDSGLRGDHTVLYTKSLLDGITSMLLASTLGIGVIFSAGAIFLYQGAIALSAKFITSNITPATLNVMINEVSAVGGILIAAIGITMLQIKKISAINLLPSIFIIALITWLRVMFG